MSRHAAISRPATAPAAPSAVPAPAAPSAVPAPALRTDGVGPITLAELNAAAGLLTRVDRKYLVPLDDTQRVVDAVADRSRVLEIDGRRGFAYSSTYFDTPALDSYLLSARKRRRRFKVRTRSYLDSGLTFLEVKTRGPRGATVKKRVPYEPDDADRLTPAGRDFVTACLLDSGTATGDAARRVSAALVPVMSTTYERTTLHLPEDEARARAQAAALRPAQWRQVDAPVVVLANMDATYHRNYYHWTLLIASRIVTALDYVGVMGVELFVTPRGLVVNEIAPRVHNSGHWTQAGCAVDQFEQHIRAVAGLALGDGKRHADVVMENLIGDDIDRLPDWLD